MKKTIILTFSFMFVFIAMLTFTNSAFAAEDPTANTNEEGDTDIDIESPVIYGISEYTISNKSKLSIEALKAALTVTDNIDSNIEPMLYEDYYTPNWQTPGTYYVTFKAKDTSGNYGTIIITIYVVDTSAPVFLAENGLPISSYSVHKSPDSVLILSEIMASVTVEDDIDGVISSVRTIEDTYTGKGDKEGSYKIVLAAKDTAGNETKFTIYINVTSSIPNKTIVFDRKNVIVENSVKLTNEDFSNILKVCGFYNTNTTTYIDIDATSYQELSENVGDYLVEYQLTTTAGTTTTGSLSVKVCESRGGENTIISESDGFFIKIIKWIWNLLKTIADFFANLFKK